MPAARPASLRASVAACCRLGQRRAKKGECTLYLDDVAQHADGQIFIALPPDDWDWREAATADTAPTAAIIPFRRSPSPCARGEGWGEGQKGHLTLSPCQAAWGEGM